MNQIYKNGINPDPRTPPPPVPGERSVKAYYNSIKDYSSAAIDIKKHAPNPNESVQEYHHRLQNLCLGVRKDGAKC